MAWLKSLERLFANNIEGFFNKRFPGELQPAEIAHATIKQFEEFYVDNEIAANKIKVFLPVVAWLVYENKRDELAEDLANYLANYCRQKQYKLDSVIVEVLKGDENALTVKCAMEENKDNLITTNFFDRETFRAIAEKQVSSLVVLRRLRGGGEAEYRLPERRVDIGRSIDSFICLDDHSISRQHAYIATENGCYVIYDNNSLNGIYVNNLRIQRQELSVGDRIRIGSSEFEFTEKTLERN